ncbi:MAG: phosphatidate cytidylyltransferase, partial [Cellulomonas sp.]|nr:phosphatidate cytidylyltransferase [Cellulomonas sp.]
MTDPSPGTTSGDAPAPHKDHGRAGRDLKAAIASGVLLLVAGGASLAIWKTAFMVIVVIAEVVAIWELRRWLLANDIVLPEQPLVLVGIVIVVVA